MYNIWCSHYIVYHTRVCIKNAHFYIGPYIAVYSFICKFTYLLLYRFIGRYIKMGVFYADTGIILVTISMVLLLRCASQPYIGKT